MDKLVIGESPEELLEAAISLALSEDVQGTSVSNRRVSSMGVKGVLGPKALTDMEKVLLFSKNTTVRSAYEAVEAAISSGTFDEGMEAELRILTKLMKSPSTKALQYHFFNARRFQSVKDSKEKSFSMNSFLLNERQPSSIPVELRGNTVEPVSALGCVGLVGGGAASLSMGKACLYAGIETIIIEVRTIEHMESGHADKLDYPYALTLMCM